MTRSALENAASIAALVLTTESLVTGIPEPPAALAAPPADYWAGIDRVTDVSPPRS